MGKILDFFKHTFARSAPQPKQPPREQLRTIVHEYYGNNVGWFAYNYASNIYQIPEVRTPRGAHGDPIVRGDLLHHPEVL